MSNSHSDVRRVVVTGMGIVSPIGIGTEPFWESITAGKSGFGDVDLMRFSAAPRNIGGEIRDFTQQAARKQYLKGQRKSIKVMCREIQLGVASANLALEDSGLDLGQIDHERFGVDFGANLMFSPPDVLKEACWSCVEENGDGRKFMFDQWGPVGLPSMEPLWLLRYLPNMPACHIGIAADARGPNNSITQDEASGNLALREAVRVIERDRADIMIAGTTGTRLHPIKTMHAALWDDLAEFSDPPETWCRPFDLSRTGQVVSEGACSFILQNEAHARQSGAKILAWLLGFGTSCVVDRDGTPNTRQALVNSMKAALRDADLSPEDIGHLNANGVGAQQPDREEAAAIREVFGDYSKELPVTALKSYLGNSGSGCGTLELAGSILGLMHDVIPPTLNYSTPDPDCPINVVHGQPLPTTNKTVMKVNVTRTGQASALIARVE